eukprot:12398758-Karenia_brevis.AAC.1
MEKCTGLSLKCRKCVFILVRHELTPAVIVACRTHLRTAQTSWASFRIAGEGKYLGLWVGPKAGGHEWDEPLSKWDTRTLTICEAK